MAGVVTDIGSSCELLALNMPTVWGSPGDDLSIETTKSVAIMKNTSVAGEVTTYLYDSGGAIRNIPSPVQFGFLTSGTKEKVIDGSGTMVDVFIPTGSLLQQWIYLKAFKFAVTYTPGVTLNRGERLIQGQFGAGASTLRLKVTNVTTPGAGVLFKFKSTTGATYNAIDSENKQSAPSASNFVPSISFINTIQPTDTTPQGFYIKYPDVGSYGRNQKNYLCYDAPSNKFFVKNLNEKNIKPADITQFAFGRTTSSRTPVPGVSSFDVLTGVGIGLYTPSMTNFNDVTPLAQLGFVSYSSGEPGVGVPVLIYRSNFSLINYGSNAPLTVHTYSGTGNINNPASYTTVVSFGGSATDTTQQLQIERDIFDVEYGLQTVLFRYGEQCTDNLFLKVPTDGTSITQAGVPVASSNPFNVLDYFSESDARRSFQFFFEDNGRLDSAIPGSNTYTWWVANGSYTAGTSIKWSNIWVDSSTDKLVMTSPGGPSPPSNQGWIIKSGDDTGSNDSSNVALVWVTGISGGAFSGKAYAINPPRALAVDAGTGAKACTSTQPAFGMISSSTGLAGLHTNGLRYALKCVKCTNSASGSYCTEDKLAYSTSITAAVSLA
jgi:hypothetical protein